MIPLKHYLLGKARNVTRVVAAALGYPWADGTYFTDGTGWDN